MEARLPNDLRFLQAVALDLAQNDPRLVALLAEQVWRAAPAGGL